MCDHDDEGPAMLRVILPVGQVPIYSTVTKIKGTKPYTVYDKLKLYNDKNIEQVLETHGVRYLVSGDNNIQLYNLDKDVEWHVSEDGLLRWLEDRNNTSQ